MRDTDLYSQLFGLRAPWYVEDVSFDREQGGVTVKVAATALGVHNGHTESMNSRIQRIKRQACGFRNRERFRNAIYFRCGGLDLHPKTLRI